MSQLSKYTTLQEVIKSNTATVLQIQNIPNSEQVENLRLVCTEVFDKVREHFGKPIGITRYVAGYRWRWLRRTNIATTANQTGG